MAPFSLTPADVRELDDGGGAVHKHLPDAAEDGFPRSPTFPGKMHPAIYRSLFATPLSLFEGPPSPFAGFPSFFALYNS